MSGKMSKGSKFGLSATEMARENDIHWNEIRDMLYKERDAMSDDERQKMEERMSLTASLMTDEFAKRVTEQLIDWIQILGPVDLKTTLSYGMVPDWEVCLRKPFTQSSSIDELAHSHKENAV